MDEPEITQITAQAPASVSNVCCGFDILGFPLNDPVDLVTVSFTESSDITISSVEGDDGKLSKDPKKNIIGIVAQSFLNSIESNQGVDLQLKKGMPIGSGLGSSAASAVATAVAMNALFDTPFTHEQLLEFALEGETQISGSRHADNVAPALHGGLVLVKSMDPLDIYPIPCALDLQCVVVYPHMKILTHDSRSNLSQEVPLSKVVAQSTHIAGLVLAIMTGDRELLAKSLCDEIFEPQRCSQIPGYHALKAAALSHGAIGCGISGSGPSIFALCETPLQAIEIGNAHTRSL